MASLITMWTSGVFINIHRRNQRKQGVMVVSIYEFGKKLSSLAILSDLTPDFLGKPQYFHR